jgi:HPt (histidine-containing phosphotransfer) domain-containing protein
MAPVVTNPPLIVVSNPAPVMVKQQQPPQRFCSARDWSNLEKVAHSAKGAAAQIGACKISSIAKEIEFAAKAKDPSERAIASCFDELTRAMEETFEYLTVS